MKRIAALLCVTALITSCATTSFPRPPFRVIDDYGDNVVSIDVPGLRKETGLLSSGKPTGIDLVIQNTSSKSISLIWEFSRITSDRTKEKVWISSQRLIDAGQPAPEQIFPPGYKLTVSVYPAGNIHNSGEMSGLSTMIFPITSKEVDVDLAFKVDGKDRTYTINIDMP